MRARFAALVLHGAMTAGEQGEGSADFSGPSACPRGIKVGVYPAEE